MASQEADAVQHAKRGLENQAKKTQDYVGGGHDKSSVVATQVVVPSKIGQEADEEIRFLKNENSKLRVQLKDCEEAFHLANHETEKSNKVARDAKQRIQELEKENEDLRKSVQSVGAKASDLELELKNSHSTIKELESKLKKDEKGNDALIFDVDRLKATVHDRELKVRSLDEEIAEKEESLKQKLVEKNIQVEELSSKAKHFESRAIPAEEKVSELDLKARDLSAERAGVEADLSHQLEVNERKDATITDKDAGIAEYQEELRNAVTRANRLGAALRTEEEKLAAVKAEAEEQRTKLEEKVAAAEVEAEELRTKSAADSAHAGVLAERIGALEKTITATENHSLETERVMKAKVKEEAAEARAEAEKQNIASTKANEMKTETGGLLSSIADLKFKMFGATSKAKESDAAAKAQAEEADEAKSKTSKLESELEGVKEKASEADSATVELKQKESKLGEMDQGLQVSGQRVADIGEKVSTLRRERDDAIASADSNATRVEGLVTRIADLESHLQEVGVKVEDHQAAMKGRKADVIHKVEQARQLQEQVVNSERNLKEGDEEFVEASSSLSSPV